MILTSDRARVALGVIRLINGTLALIAPRAVARMFGVNPETNGAAVYVLRLFGIRTVFLGAELLLTSDPERRHDALRAGVVIHGSDTVAAAWAGMRGDLPKRAALTGTVVSGANTALALIAIRSSGSPDGPAQSASASRRWVGHARGSEAARGVSRRAT